MATLLEHITSNDHNNTMTELKVMDGHVFTPSLQDISLKRFRMRYCPQSDGYFLHWDNKVGQHLARIKGLENGVYNMFGVQRYINEEGNQSFISYEKSASDTNNKKESDEISESTEKSDQQSEKFVFPPSVSWKLDFSESGLAIKNIKIKARFKQSSQEDASDLYDEESVTFNICGDKDSQVDEQVYLGDYYTEIPILKGSKSVVLTAHLHSNKGSNNPVVFLPSSLDQRFDTPLDIVINLMCLKREEWSFVGEILLGLKYSQSGASESLREKPDITVDCGVMGGQLQVHIVEGAGLVKQGTKKAFNSFVKCQLLPDQNNTAVKQTSPKHNAYPTWTKEFIFAGVDKYDLIHGGVEVLLYDHHKFFSKSLIGGLRLSLPQKVSHDPMYRFSTGGTIPITQPLSRETSPVPSPPQCNTPGPSTASTHLLDISDLATIRQLSASQPDLLSIDSEVKPFSNTHFATINRPGKISVSPVSSPLTRRVPVFTVPRNRESPTSPFGSPRFLRKNRNSPKLSLSNPSTLSARMKGGGELMYWWMDSTRNEIVHWRKALNNPGQWVYCWHILRPEIKPAYSS